MSETAVERRLPARTWVTSKTFGVLRERVTTRPPQPQPEDTRTDSAALLARCEGEK